MRKILIVMLAVAAAPAKSDQSLAEARLERDCRVILLEAENGKYTTAKRLFSLPPEKVIEICEDLIELIELAD
jgi:hypothetical protein